MWLSGAFSVFCADMSRICCATALRLAARSCAWEASLAASPASLSSIQRLLGHSIDEIKIVIPSAARDLSCSARPKVPRCARDDTITVGETDISALHERRMDDLAVLRDQRALHHLVVRIDLQAPGFLVDHRRDEVQQVAREQRR